MESTVHHWDKLWEKNLDEPPHVGMIKDLISIAKKNNITLKNKKILEVGAGSGVDSLTLSKITGCKSTCVDYSLESLSFMKKNFKQAGVKAAFIKADAQKLPFKDNSFDLVFSNGVMEHFKNPFPMIEESKRVLKKEGILIIGVPQTYSFYTIKKQILMTFGKWFAGWETQYSKSDMKKIANRLKLKIIDVKIYGYPPWSFPKPLQKLVTSLHLNRFLVSDVILYSIK
jgi:ubiquinone/menaquinone biosynthesis C-methylase UbiE